MDREFGLLKIVVENLFGHEQSVMDSGDDSFQNKFKTNSINKYLVQISMQVFAAPEGWMGANAVRPR